MLRPGRSADAAALLDIEHASFSSPQWDAGSILRYECTVALIDGKIAGFLVSRKLAEDEREILNLAVDPSCRRCGVASALLSNELLKPGTHFLEVRESNTGARALYEKYGFQEVGRREAYYELPAETAIVMSMK